MTWLTWSAVIAVMVGTVVLFGFAIRGADVNTSGDNILAALLGVLIALAGTLLFALDLAIRIYGG